MAITLNGSTGIVSANIADGTIAASDLASSLDLSGKAITYPSGTVLKFLQTYTTTSYSTTSTTALTNIFSDIVFTPKSGSKVLMFATLASWKFGNADARATVRAMVDNYGNEVGRDIGYTLGDIRSPFTFTYGFTGTGNQVTLNWAYMSVDGGTCQVNGFPGGRSDFWVMEIAA